MNLSTIQSELLKTSPDILSISEDILKTGEPVKATAVNNSGEKITLRVKDDFYIQIDADSMEADVGDEVTFRVLDNKNGKLSVEIIDVTPKAEPEILPETNEGYKNAFNKINVKMTEETLHMNKLAPKSDLELKSKNIEELKQAGKKIDAAVNNATREKIKALEDNGLSADKLSLDFLTAFIHETGTDAAVKTDEELRPAVDEHLKDTDLPAEDAALRKEVITCLLKEDLPINKKNIKAVESAYKKLQQIKEIDENVIANIVKKEKPVTLENVYMEKYASKGSDAEKLPEAVVEQLLPEIEKLFEREEIENTEKNRDTAKFLVENKLPLTKKNIEKAEFLKNIEQNTDDFDVLRKAAKNIKSDASPTNVPLISNEAGDVNAEELNVKYEQIIKDLPNITYNTIFKVIDKKKPVTIENLRIVLEDTPETELPESKRPAESETDLPEYKHPDRQKTKLPERKRPDIEETELPERKRPDEQDTGSTDIRPLKPRMFFTERKRPDLPETTYENRNRTDTNDIAFEEEALIKDRPNSHEAIKAKRCLLEIQLKLTYEAAARLSEKKIDINTLPLQEAVDELKQLEKESYEKSLKIVGASPSTENVGRMQELFEKMQVVAGSDIYSVIGDVVSGNINFSVEGMHSSAIKPKVFEDIETFATAPSPKYGDSIQNAAEKFADLLNELDIEQTEANIRAAKILSKNEIDVTHENILEAKTVDFKISEIFDKLHPLVAASMIKDGLNPVQMHVDDALSYVEEFSAEFGQSSREKLSEYILEMDDNGQLETSDRETIMAVYRMLSTIQKHGGAGIGTALKNNLDLTLGNLFEASKLFEKTKKGDDIDVSVNNDFGLLKKVITPEKNIRSTLSRIDNTNNTDMHKAANPPAQTEREQTVSAAQTIQRQITSAVNEITTDMVETIIKTGTDPMELSIDALVRYSYADKEQRIPESEALPEQKEDVRLNRLNSNPVRTVQRQTDAVVQDERNQINSIIRNIQSQIDLGLRNEQKQIDSAVESIQRHLARAISEITPETIEAVANDGVNPAELTLAELASYADREPKAPERNAVPVRNENARINRQTGRIDTVAGNEQRQLAEAAQSIQRQLANLTPKITPDTITAMANDDVNPAELTLAELASYADREPKAPERNAAPMRDENARINRRDSRIDTVIKNIQNRIDTVITNEQRQISEVSQAIQSRITNLASEITPEITEAMTKDGVNPTELTPAQLASYVEKEPKTPERNAAPVRNENVRLNRQDSRIDTVVKNIQNRIDAVITNEQRQIAEVSQSIQNRIADLASEIAPDTIEAMIKDGVNPSELSLNELVSYTDKEQAIPKQRTMPERNDYVSISRTDSRPYAQTASPVQTVQRQAARVVQNEQNQTDTTAQNELNQIDTAIRSIQDRIDSILKNEQGQIAEVVKSIQRQAAATAAQITPNVIEAMIKDGVSPMELNLNSLVRYSYADKASSPQNAATQTSLITLNQEIPPEIADYLLEDGIDLPEMRLDEFISYAYTRSEALQETAIAYSPPPSREVAAPLRAPRPQSAPMRKNSAPMSSTALRPSAVSADKAQISDVLEKLNNIIQNHGAEVTANIYKNPDITVKEFIHEAESNTPSPSTKQPDAAEKAATGEHLETQNKTESPDTEITPSTETETSADYVNKLISKLIDVADPEKLLKLLDAGNDLNKSSIEALIDKLSEMKQDEQIRSTAAEKLEQVRALSEASPTVIKWMEKNQIPLTVNNIGVLMSQLKNPNDFAGRLNKFEKWAKENKIPFGKNIPTTTLEQLKNGKTPEEVVNDITLEVEDAQEAIMNVEPIDNVKLALRQSASLQRFTKVAGMLNEDERSFQIPVRLSNDEITTLNVYMLDENKSADSGEFKTFLSFETSRLGIVQIHMTINNDTVDLKINSTNADAPSYISKFEGNLRAYMREAGLTVGTVKFGLEEQKNVLKEKIFSNNVKESVKLFENNYEIIV